MSLKYFVSSHRPTVEIAEFAQVWVQIVRDEKEMPRLARTFVQLSPYPMVPKWIEMDAEIHNFHLINRLSGINCSQDGEVYIVTLKKPEEVKADNVSKDAQ